MNCGIADTTQNHAYFLKFTDGNEAGLTYLYSLLHKKLLYHGLRIVSDEFVVNSAIQEAFLKAWNFRHRLSSVLHTYRFLRLNVTWKCYAYYRKPDHQRNCIVYTGNMDSYADIFYQQADTAQILALTEERLQNIYNVLPYLPANRKIIFTLYFKYGLNAKQIAKRYASSSQEISNELQKGIEQLRKIIHAQKKLNIPVSIKRQVTRYPKLLEGELLRLFKLRFEKKWSFEAIANHLNLPLAHVHQQYITAHRLLNQMRKRGNE
jgi:RNA polymerase sigma factor (sigma-70 family)